MNIRQLNTKARAIIAMAAILIVTGSAANARVRPPRYRYVTLNVPGSNPYSTFPTGINNHNVVVGYYISNTGVHGFAWDNQTKTWTAPIDDPNAVPPYGTYPLTVNDNGVFAGYYDYTMNGYTIPGGLIGVLGPPVTYSSFQDGCFSEGGYPSTTITGVSNGLVKIGYCFIDTLALDYEGWIDSNSGVEPIVCPANAPTVLPAAINNNGLVVGTAYDQNNNIGSFVSKGTSCMTTTLIDYPGTATFLTGVNDNGLAIGYASYSSGGEDPFHLLYNTSNGDMTPLIRPSAAANGVTTGQINNAGWFVGSYVDAQKHNHGFFARPVR